MSGWGHGRAIAGVLGVILLWQVVVVALGDTRVDVSLLAAGTAALCVALAGLCWAGLRAQARVVSDPAPVRLQARDLLLAVVRETEPDLDGHHDDVGHLTQQLAVRLGFAGEELDVVVKGAELHDVGKVAIPTDLLNKPSGLDDKEWALIRQHTVIGSRILAAAPGLGPVAELVRASHERWDGHGYPDGLRGPEIPLGARVISVCDSFDAMVSDRPYARSVSVRDALDELARCAGAQFDPEVVEAFIAMMRGGQFGVGVAVSAQTDGGGDHDARKNVAFRTRSVPTGSP